MGKIQDAIRKVQRDRGVAVSSRPDKGTPATRDSDAMPQIEGKAEVPDHSGDQRAWKYGGREIAVEKRTLIESGLLDPDYARKHLSRVYRDIKTTLLTSMVDDPASRIRRGNLIMVSSAEVGEGKSFISLNLSISLAAESGFSVVLVDSNSSQPRLSEVIGTGTEKGWVDLLDNPSLDVTQLISPTDIPDLSVLLAGKKDDQAAEMLASDKATEFFDDLSTADPKRIFIFDSPPMLSSKEASALAEQVGQILFVVKAGKTPQRSVLQALDKLNRNRPISIVLNQIVD